MKRFRKSFIVYIMIVIFSFESNTVYAKTIYSQDYFNYYIKDESVIISDYFGSESEVTVPAMIAGYPVSGIATGAFSDSNTVTHVNLPDTIMEVQSGAIRAGITVTYNSNTDHPQGTLPEMKESENNSQNTNTSDSSASKKEDTADNKISDTIENGNGDFSGDFSLDADENHEMSISGGQVSKEEMEQIAAKQEEIDKQRESEKNLDLAEGIEAVAEAETLSEIETETSTVAESQSETEAMTESELESETEEAADSGKDFPFAVAVIAVLAVVCIVWRRKK